jgi:MFS family permease
VSALSATLLSGAVAARIGPRTTMLAGLALSTGAYLLYPLVRETWHAFALAVAAGGGIGTWLTMQSTLLATITPPELRHRAFAQQRVAANVGLGLGGFTAGLLVSVADPPSFTRLFVLNAVTFVAYGTAVLAVALPASPAGTVQARGSYREVLRDRPFVALALVQVVLVAAAVAPLASLLPVYAHNTVGAAEHTIGLLFLAN